MSIWPSNQSSKLSHALKNPALSGSSSHFPGNIVTQCRYSISRPSLTVARDQLCSHPGSCICSAHSRFCTHGKQHSKAAGSHTQLMKESATAMRPAIPMSMFVLSQRNGARVDKIVDAFPILGERGHRCAWLPTTEAPSAAAFRCSYICTIHAVARCP